MNKIFKRKIALLLAMIMALGVMPMNVLAEGAETSSLTFMADETASGGAMDGVESGSSIADLSLLETSNYISGTTVELTGFEPKVTEYTIETQNAATGYKLRATAVSEDAVIEAHWTNIAGAKKTTVLTSGSTSFSIMSSALSVGENIVEVVVTVGDVSKTYTITIIRPKSSDASLKSITVTAPNSITSMQYAYDLKSDGTLFKNDGSTGFSSDNYEYKMYISNNISSINLKPTATTGKGAKIRIECNGVTTDIMESGDTYNCNLNVGSNDMVIYSESEDNTHKVSYHIEVIRVSDDTLLNGISGENISVDYISGYTSVNMYVDNGAESAQVLFNIPEGAELRDGTRYAYNDTVYDNNTVTFDTSGSSGTKYVWVVNGGSAAVYSVYWYKKSAYRTPDSVTEYLPAPSQYTNSLGYGYYINKTLLGIGGTTSLGNFGGYAIYKFDEPVYNSDRNKYGIDFSVYGNAFNYSPTTMEPANVYVSQDGSTWYSLAGSEHYQDSVIWDYSITYKDNGTNKVDYYDSLGESGAVSSAVSPYPDKDIYTSVSIPENELTLSGVLIQKDLETRSTAAKVTADCAFGYGDVHMSNGGYDGVTANPYIENHSANKKGDGMDISWAVDENGMPVELEYINYVKVQSGVLIDGGGFGEKSAEINAIIVADQQENNVGKTKGLSGVILSNTEDDSNAVSVDFEADKYTYNIEVEDASDYRLGVVGASSEDNIYVNNQRLTYTGDCFTSATAIAVDRDNERLIRVIVQNGDMEPVIYMLSITQSIDLQERVTETGNNVSLGYTGTQSEWIIMDNVAYGVADNGLSAEDKVTYIQSIVDKASTSKSITDIERIVIALSALGIDATDVKDSEGNTINLIDKIATGNATSINGAVFGLLAYNSGGYKVTEGNTPEVLINTILDKHLEDGGWTFFGNVSDPDMTGMAISALAPYYLVNSYTDCGLTKATYDKVQAAVEAAVAKLSDMQSESGAWASYGAENANSTAMAIVALGSLGIDIDNDLRFTKGENTAIAGLMSFAVKDNSGFGYKDNASVNASATEQAFRALAVYKNVKADNKPYDVYSNSYIDNAKYNTVDVKFNLLGDDVHGDSVHTDYVYWLENYDMAVKEDATVADVMKTITSIQGYTFIGLEEGYVTGVTTPSGLTLSGMDNGVYSCWLLKVNGVMPEVGINDYVLKAGDVIEFFYTDDYRPIFGMMPIYGDVDNDGILTGNDAAYILQYSNNSSFINADSEWTEKADVDGDGFITANDAAMVYQKVLISTYRFPVEY